MSYTTLYSLEIRNYSSDLELQQIFAALTGVREAGYALNLRVPSSSYDSRAKAKWYNHPQDMAALSKKFPTVLFVLEGAGEDISEPNFWRSYFQNGKYQRCKAELCYPEFDPTWTRNEGRL